VTNEEIYAQAYAEAEAAETARIKAILNSPEAQGAPDLARYLAFETFESAEKAIGVIRMHGATSPAGGSASASYETRKAAAGSLGLEDYRTASSKDAQQIWDEAVVKSHRAQGIDDPEIGATGRNLQ